MFATSSECKKLSHNCLLAGVQLARRMVPAWKHFLGTGIPEEEFPHEDKAKTRSTTKIEAKLGMTHAFWKRQVIVDGI